MRRCFDRLHDLSKAAYVPGISSSVLESPMSSGTLQRAAAASSGMAIVTLGAIFVADEMWG